MANNKFYLYVVRHEDIKPNEPYFLVTPTYSLLYTKHKPPKRSEKVEDETILPDLAKRWLSETVDTIRREDMQDASKRLLRQSAEFQQRLAVELEAERQKLKKEAVTTNGNNENGETD